MTADQDQGARSRARSYEPPIVIEIPLVRCPRCSSTDVQRYCTRGAIRYFRCRECRDQERGGRRTTFKVRFVYV